MIKPVKTAVVGCGMISESYLPTMLHNFNILEVVGVCDAAADKAQKAAEKYGVKAMTMEEILADPSIEIVVNLTTPTAHYPVIKRLLEGGKNVYTEKILTIELEQAAELLKIANEKKLYLGSAPDTFLGAAIQTARFVVDSGMIGDVTSCYCALNRDGSLFGVPGNFTTKPGGGIGFDVGIYSITALLSILGPVTEVSGVTRTINPQRKDLSLEHFGETYPILNETLMAGTLQFASGTVGTVLFDSNSTFLFPEQPALVLIGSLGVMYMADPNSFGGEVKVILKGNNQPMIMQQCHAYTAECRGLGVAEMAWSMRMGRKNRANKEMAYHAMEVLHSIVKSSQSRANVELQSTFEKMPALPRGHVGPDIFRIMEEDALM
jgi:predicted dehydrogenase